MKKFIEAYRHFKNIKSIGNYRICWMHTSDGNGFWCCIEFFDDEIEKIDKSKCEICVY